MSSENLLDDRNNDTKAAELMSAQNKAVDLFDQIVSRKLIRSGALESQISNEVFELAHQMYGIENTGTNALCAPGRTLCLRTRRIRPTVR